MQSKLSRKSALICAVVYAAALAFSLVTRILAQRILPREGVAVIRNVLSLKLTYNTGAAFSFLKSAPALANVLSAAVLIAVILFLITGRMRDVCRYALTAVAAGGADNLICRLFHGAVTDMIRVDFISFPVFNCADICVTLGVIVFAIGYLTDKGDR